MAELGPLRKTAPLRGDAGTGVLRRAFEQWCAGDYHLCLSILEQAPSESQTSESVLLSVRALLRVGRHAEAERRLVDEQLRHRSTDALATHAMLLGVARARARDFDGAVRCFTRARRGTPHHSILAETAYEHAIACYQDGKHDMARKILVDALRPIEDIVYARALALSGWLDVAAGHYAQAREQFSFALITLKQCRTRDIYLQASLIFALAIFCAELGVGDPATLHNEIQALNWPSSCLGSYVQSLHHIGLAYHRHGSHRIAGSCFVAAADAGEGTAWSIFGLAECANLASHQGEPVSAELFASKALRIVERIDANGGWETIDDEQRYTLLVLAAALARIGHGAEAERLCALYRERTTLSVLNSANHDIRLATFRSHIEAIVLGALGATESASTSLREIAAVWDRIGYRYRASEALADADRLTGATTPRPAPANTTTPIYEAGAARLSLRDEQILQMVATGSGDDDIAQRFGISRRTARNVVNGLYGKFGVHTRAQLVVAINASR